MSSFKISIITVNKNNRIGLESTISSVVSQTYKLIEYIIVDGNSQDGSVNVIHENKHNITKWISEDDRGIYAAMNKGINMSSGEYLLFLNSGDVLVNENVLSDLMESIYGNPDLLSGNIWLSSNGERTGKLKSISKLSLKSLIQYGLMHPATLIKRTLFEKYGLYNENNQVVSDWEFFLVAAGLNSVNYQSVDIDVAVFDSNGISMSNKELVKKETEIILEKLIPPAIQEDLNELAELRLLISDKTIRHLRNIKSNKFLYKLSSLFLSILNKLVVK